MNVNIESWLEKHTKLCLIILFIVGIILYGFIAKNMSMPLYVQNDEDLYVNMARSFFYEGNFSREYTIMNYSCVVYSIILSVAYFFYTPENILFIMRMIGVLLIVSSIFPAYLLGKKILDSKFKALFIAGFMLIVPDMLSSSFLIQENLNYPIFLWIAYFVYCKFTEEKSMKREAIILLLLALIFFTKSYAIVFAGSYFLCLLIYNVKEKDWKEVRNVFIEGLIFCVIISIGLFIIYAINDFQTGTNHYSTQIMSIFPLSLKKVGYFIYGFFCYLIFSIFSFGMIPVLMPLFNYKEYSKEDRKFLSFIAIATILTAIESSIIVYIPEEANKILPWKICVRYLAVFMIPYILLFMKLKDKKMKVSKWIYLICTLIILYIDVWFVKTSYNISVIDAYVFEALFYLNVTKNKMGLLIIEIILVIVLLWLELKRRGKIKNTNIYIAGFVVFLLFIIPINSKVFQWWSNIHLNGETLISDHIKLAKFLKQDYDKVYAFNLDEYYFFGTLNCDYEKYFKSPVLEENTEDKKVAIIMIKNTAVTTEGVKKVDIGTGHFDVYVSDENYSKLHMELQVKK